MISNEEMIMFMKEINLLIKEYKRCDDEYIKRKINDDIFFLSEIIKQ
jgi:hypothetical protein